MLVNIRKKDSRCKVVHADYVVICSGFQLEVKLVKLVGFLESFDLEFLLSWYIASRAVRRPDSNKEILVSTSFI